MNVDPDFAQHVAPLDIAALSASRDVIYIVDRGFVLRGYNQAWLDFAEENGGAAMLARYPVGSSILDAMSPAIRRAVTHDYETALRTGRPAERTFECSSPGVFRRYEQTQYPLPSGAGWVTTNHLVESREHDRQAHAWSRRYLDDAGRVLQCSHCRRTLDQESRARWDWVPSLVARPRSDTRLSLCPMCREYYERATRVRS